MSESYTSPTELASEEPVAPSRKSWKVLLPLVILALPIVVLWGYGEEEGKAPLNTLAAEPELVDPVEEGPTDEEYRQLLVGSWEMERNGRRFITLHADGTAEMTVELASKWSLLFGKQLQFNIEWAIEEGVLTMITTGGEPKGKVELLTSMYGAERVQPIKILDKTTLRLPDDDPDGEDHIWTRVEP
ncbi:MAG: hypothetical protein HUJ26_24195 [Planctomycetaceae bacterium]|nr:hypothetical protein [Planctomycetaceae bacterium]